MYHRINTADEERVLEQMLELQAEIRAQREKQRKTKTYNSEKYSKMFEPVTKTLGKLVPTPIANLMDLETPTVGEPKEESLMLQEPGELYKHALREVPRKLRDDGKLGLDTDDHRIGDYIYEVEGNVLQVLKNGEEKRFEITDLNLWKMLIVMNPVKIQLTVKKNKQYLPFVYEYADIVNELNLMDLYVGSKNRVKYKILKELHQGGFLFSVQPPTIVIPSDNQGLMSELYKALAELRAGNSSMRNLLVPLAQEANRKNILPPHLLSPDEETWVFA